MTSLASVKGPSVTLGLRPDLVSENKTRAPIDPTSTPGGGYRALAAASFLQRFVVLHHGSHGLGVWHGARLGLLVPLGDHQHHESHRHCSCAPGERKGRNLYLR